MQLQTFLDNKPLYYDEIDYGRMPRLYKKLQTYLPQPKIIHIVGTNGKGTTGRFLATALKSSGFRVGHYTSPHILKFNERVWLDGSDGSDDVLDNAHNKLQTLLTQDELNSLSYFEYTTFVAMFVFKECEYVVLEAGLGGEYDATAVFKNVLTLITKIDKDHESFLGTTIKQIATTKLNGIQKQAILGYQNYDEVYEVAKNFKTFRVEEFIDMDEVDNFAKKLNIANYLKQNLALSISALKFLEIDYDEKSFENSKLFGRLSKISPNVIVDVGHNVLAAKAIVSELKPKKYIVVYNSFKDKNYEKVLEVLKPIILRVEVISVADSRIVPTKELQKVLDNLEIKYKNFLEIKDDENYLVFGSFSVIETFLKGYCG